MLFMLFLPKAETIFMKGIYDNVRMVLTFGGAIFILFIWVRFVEKTFFIHWLLEREMDEKVFKRCVNRVFIYFNASYSTIINGECEIASTTYYLNSDSRNSRISSCIFNTRQRKKLLYEVGYSRFFLLEVVYGLE